MLPQGANTTPWPPRILRCAMLAVGCCFGQPPGLWAQAGGQAAQVAVKGTLAGRVISAEGTAASGATVRLARADGMQQSTTTDAHGAFAFQGLAFGRYELQAERAGLRSARLAVAVTGDPSSSMRLTLPAAAGSPAAELEFSDQPSFTVAGVTDWTAAGGHGSDTTLRAGEDLTRRTLALQALGAISSSNTQDAGEMAAEETKLRAALTASPRNYEANHALGAFYVHHGRFQEAIAPLTVAADLHHPTAEDEFNLALACQGLGDPAKAKQHILRALREGDEASFHRVAGQLDEQLGDPLGATQQEQQATTLAPSEENYFVWGSELLLHRAVREATEVFATGAGRHPRSPRLQTGWGTALFAGAQYGAAAEHLCEAAQLAPDQTEPYLFLGKIVLVAPTSPACVLKELALFQQQHPGSPQANFFEAMALLQQGSASDRAAAIALLRKALALDPKDADASLQLGILASQEGRSADAITLLQQAVAADPQLPEAHYRLGIAYRRSGEHERARQQFALHDQLAGQQAAAAEQQRRKIKQFVVTPVANGAR